MICMVNFVHLRSFLPQEQYIPIDIHTNKLLDWLVSRRHCIRDWQPQVQVIREKINNAIQDMPIHEGITRLLSGTCKFFFPFEGS